MIATDSQADLLAANDVTPLLAVGSQDRLHRDFCSPEGSQDSSLRASPELSGTGKRRAYTKMELSQEGPERRLAVVEGREALDVTLNLPPKAIPAPFGVSTLRQLRTRKPALSDAKASFDQEQDESETEPAPALPPRQAVVDAMQASSGGRVSSLSDRTASLKSAHVPPNGFFDIEMQCKRG